MNGRRPNARERARLRRTRELREKRWLREQLAAMVARGELRFATRDDGALVFFEPALDEAGRRLW